MIYDKYPEFIEKDPRTQRKNVRSYSITKEFSENRHESFFINYNLKNKTVLDLGSCVGSMGPWVLEKGAEYYHGVEYDKTLSDISKANLTKYFDKNKWDITNDYIENFFENNNKKYDIVIASGIIYTYFNPSDFLDQIIKISDCVLIESGHPLKRWIKESVFNIPGAIPLKHLESLEKLPLVVYYPGNASMMLSDKATNLKFNGSCPTLGFVDYYLDLMGYSNEQQVHSTIKTKLPEIYNSDKRFACMYVKNTIPTAVGFKEAFTKKDFTVTGYYND